MLDATTEALVIIIAAVVVAIGGGGLHCSQRNECMRLKTCTNTSMNAWFGLSCSFSNFVNLAGDRAYNGVAGETFVASTRGVCAPGERIHATSDMATATCAPYYTYPDALNAEIMDATATERHDQACGAWIDAVDELSVPAVTSYSFYDDDNFQAAVKTAEQKIYSGSHMGFTDMGKFYASCQRTVVSGTSSIRASAVEAYAMLSTAINTTTYAASLESLGRLSAHACDSPVDLGFGVSASSSFHIVARRGTEFATGDFREALFALEQSSALQDQAEEANQYVTDYAFNSPVVKLTDYEHLYEGASGRTDHDNVPLTYDITPEFDGFALMASHDLPLTSAYLHGLAARCAFNLWGALDAQQGGVGDLDFHLRSRDAKSTTAERPVALGRLKPAEPGFALPTNETVVNSTVVTFGKLRASPQGNAEEDCAEMVRFLFPDRLDRMRFGLLVPDRLYAKLETVVSTMKQHVADALNYDLQLQGLNVDTSKVIGHIQNTKVRIPGAPRGSWAGVQRSYVDGHLDSSKGPLLMALQQSYALFQDRVHLAFDFQGHCAGPAVYDSLASNGYVYPGAPRLFAARTWPFLTLFVYAHRARLHAHPLGHAAPSMDGRAVRRRVLVHALRLRDRPRARASRARLSIRAGGAQSSSVRIPGPGATRRGHCGHRCGRRRHPIWKSDGAAGVRARLAAMVCKGALRFYFFRGKESPARQL